MGVAVPAVRSLCLAVQREGPCARRVGTVYPMSGFVTTRTTVAMAQMRRVSDFACVWQWLNDRLILVCILGQPSKLLLPLPADVFWSFWGEGLLWDPMLAS